MPHITHQTPSPYWNRHSDWYQGVFKQLCHAWGLQAELAYYLSMEKECVEVETWFSFDFLGMLNWLKRFIIDIKINTYNKNYLSVYDENALGGCKFAEGFEAQLNVAFNKIKEAYDNAVAQAQAMVTKVSDYITQNIVPAVQNAQNQVSQITNYINQQLTPVVNSAQQTANNVKTQVDATITKVNNVVTDLNTKTQQINALDAQAQKTINQLNDAIAKLNSAISTINTHTSQIQDLYNHLQASPSTPVSSSSSLKEKLGLNKIL